MKLIHYGSWKYDLDKFNPIKNTTWVKPDGGLWSSPVDSKYGWKEWCIDENFRVKSLKQYFILELNKNAKILTIETEDDLYSQLKWITYEKPFGDAPNFEDLITQGFDAIHLTADGQWNTRLTHPRNLYGWDCETVLILNPLSVTQLDKSLSYKDTYKKTIAADEYVKK